MARSRIALRLLVGGIAVLLAEPAAECQGVGVMGFSRQFDFLYEAGGNFHLISLPWNYQPVDVGIAGVLDAEDLCADLGGAEKVATVARWIEGSSTISEYSCGSVAPFALSTGTAYGVRNAPGQEIHEAIVGSHDNAFSYSVAPTGGSQLTWVSVPYHFRSTQRTGSTEIDASDICLQAGSTEILAVVRWNSSTSVFETYGCGSELVAPFALLRGDGYGIVNRGNQTISWQPVHY